MIRCCRQTVVAVLVGAITGFSSAQTVAPASRSPGSRVDAAVRNTVPATPRRASMRLLLGQVVSQVDFQNTTAREAFEWWSQTTNIPLIVHWAVFEQEGVDLDTEMTLRLRNIPAGVLLKLMTQQWSPETRFVIEPTPWVVEVMTRQQAIRNTVLRVYDIGGLLHRVPNFNNAPAFDLSSALGNTNSGGGGNSGGSSSGGSGLFGDTNRDRERQDVPSRAERAEDIAQVIRDTIEPDIWQNNGGQFCSIRYFSGRLIVNAPPFVHRQIGMPSARSGRRSTTGMTGGRSQRSTNNRRADALRFSRGVSGVGTSMLNRTSGVTGR